MNDPKAASTDRVALGPTQTLRCPTCAQESAVESVLARDRFFGTPGEFVYHACALCGSLWLSNIPDLEQYYPSTYYSLAADRTYLQSTLREIATAVLTLKTFLTLDNLPKRSARILDVGCGDGYLLRGLRRFGYRYLEGIDPFIPSSSTDGITLARGSVAATRGPYDVIMFHHSLEHVADPETVLALCRERLRSDGVVLVRIPVPNYAWRRYRERWVQLDAPRHLHLMSESGFGKLAERAGFAVRKVTYDSTPFQFWGSEAYVRGLLLKDIAPRTLPQRLRSLLLTARWWPRVISLNRRREGDMAAFLLRAER